MDKLQKAYKRSIGYYDKCLISNSLFYRFYRRLFWGWSEQRSIFDSLMKQIPDDFNGHLLDVPVGTMVFTANTYARLSKAQVEGLDYSHDMLGVAKQRVAEKNLANVHLQQGDVGKMPFADGHFDYVLCFNGMHVFPDKAAAAREITRVVKPGGKLMVAHYVRKQRLFSDMMTIFFAWMGWFTPPADTREQAVQRWSNHFHINRQTIIGSFIVMEATRK